MDKKEFFTHWEASHRITCKAFRMIPAESVCQTVIPGLKPPGELFCHIYSHVDASLSACISGSLTTEAILKSPDAVNTNNAEQCLAYAQTVMDQIFAHASVSDTVWDKLIAAPWGAVPMRSMCLDAYGHEMHHRGQLFAMLRILNISPPSACMHD
jgi:uncharacterized damage-inducible protein DinB